MQGRLLALVAIVPALFAAFAIPHAAPVASSSSLTVAPPGASHLVLDITDVPRSGGWVQVVVTSDAPVNVSFRERFTWHGAGIEGVSAAGVVHAFSGRPLTSNGAGGGGTLSTVDARIGTVGVSCCDAVRIILPSLPSELSGYVSSGGSGHGKGHFPLAAGERLTYTVYATSWGDGSEENIVLDADRATLHATAAAPVAGGVHAYDIFADARPDGTYVKAFGVGAGHAGSARLDAVAHRGYFLTAMVSTSEDGATSLSWRLPNGSRGSVGGEDHAMLTAGGRATGPLELVASADPEIGSVLAGPQGSSGAWGFATFGDFDPGASGVSAFPMTVQR